MLRKTKADIGKSPHQLFVLVCVSEIVAAVYQIIICYFTAHEHFFLKCHCTIIPNIPLAKIILNITICLYLPQAKSLTHTLSACYPTAYTVPPATTQLSSSTFIKKYNIQLIRPESSHAPQLTSYATAYSPPQLDSASLHLAVCCRQVLPLRNTAPSS